MQDQDGSRPPEILESRGVPCMTDPPETELPGEEDSPETWEVIERQMQAVLPLVKPAPCENCGGLDKLPDGRCANCTGQIMPAIKLPRRWHGIVLDGCGEG